MTLQPVQSRAQGHRDGDQVRDQSKDRLTIAQINERFLHYAGAHWRRSVYRFLASKGVAIGRRSRRCLLIKQSEIERALNGASPLKSHQRSA